MTPNLDDLNAPTSAPQSNDAATTADLPTPAPAAPSAPTTPREIGGRDGPEPTRFGDWELRGRCIDF